MFYNCGIIFFSKDVAKHTLSNITHFSSPHLQDFMDPVGNFSIYRAHLERAISEANQGKGKKNWVIPFFSLIVKDIYFMQQSSAK